MRDRHNSYSGCSSFWTRRRNATLLLRWGESYHKFFRRTVSRRHWRGCGRQSWGRRDTSSLASKPSPRLSRVYSYRKWLWIEEDAWGTREGSPEGHGVREGRGFFVCLIPQLNLMTFTLTYQFHSSTQQNHMDSSKDVHLDPHLSSAYIPPSRSRCVHCAFWLIQVAEAQRNTDYTPTLSRKKVTMYNGKLTNLHSGFPKLSESNFWLKSGIRSKAGLEKLPGSFSSQSSHYNATSMPLFCKCVTQRRGSQSFASKFVWAWLRLFWCFELRF